MTKPYIKYILSSPYKNQLLACIEDLSNHHFENYDIKKLKGHENYYRVRIGKVRIIYRILNNEVEICAIDNRGDIY